MSFILDALKKAESERSRSAGPVLMDARVVRQRQRLPAWAWILGAVLVANLLLLGWMVFRGKAPAPALAQSAPPVATPVPPVVPPEPTATTPAVVLSPPFSAPPAMEELPSLAPEPATVPAPEPAPAPAPERARRAAAAPVPRIDNLPTAQDLVAQGVQLPALQLLLLAYDDLPANRFVLLNARRLREGDEVADGIRLESIVPTGIVLNAGGRRFVVLAGS